tara:strand:- start:2862 stop:4010 length:1149 start_codon:yes stop_codon:yes gene_type:complete
MKKFSRFITEAQDSLASQRAKKMGLKGDGHGGWYSASGEFVAKTEGGDLKFYNKGQRPGRDVPPDQQKKPKEPEKPQQEPASEDGGGGNKVTLVFGKFNPPTKNHQQLFTSAKGIAGDSDFRIYPSRGQDSEMNPLKPDTKIDFMKKMFPSFKDNIMNDDEAITIFDVLQKMENDGYREVTIVVGADRLGEFRGLAQKHNGSLYNFDDITVVAGGQRDGDNETSSKMREYATQDNFDGFKSGLPTNFKDSEKLFKKVKSGIGVETKSEMWKVSPVLNYQNLRDHYVRGEIFRKGTIVESANTGLRGKIIRCGTNYLICATEDKNVMFKSWITDVVEKKAFTDVSGVPADQREVGTPALTQYTMRMADVKSIRNFINKYKDKK